MTCNKTPLWSSSCSINRQTSSCPPEQVRSNRTEYIQMEMAYKYEGHKLMFYSIQAIPVKSNSLNASSYNGIKFNRVQVKPLQFFLHYSHVTLGISHISLMYIGLNEFLYRSQSTFVKKDSKTLCQGVMQWNIWYVAIYETKHRPVPKYQYHSYTGRQVTRVQMHVHV